MISNRFVGRQYEGDTKSTMPKSPQKPIGQNLKQPLTEGLPLVSKDLLNPMASEVSFRLLFEALPNPYLILYPDSPIFTIAGVSDGYLLATGTCREDIVGKGIFQVFPDDPNDPSSTSVHDLRISLEHVVQERVSDTMGIQKYDIPRRDSPEGGFEVRYWSPVQTPVFGTDGSLMYIIHRVEDITDFVLMREQSAKNGDFKKIEARAERMEAEVLRSSHEVKEANRQLKATNKQLERRERELAQLNEKLQELDRLKTAFFSNISHEFRTPLTLMLGPIQDTLKDVNTIPENRERIEVAYRNALRLLKLVNNLLDFSRIEAGRAQASYQPVDLAKLTQELASMFDSAIDKASLKFNVDCQPVPEPVYVDPEMWEKIVLNLVSNAFKHTFLGEIEVRLRWKKSQVELMVRDTGVGISAEQLPHVFERFHRVPHTRSRTNEGSGIGLALVAELVKLHHGTVNVESVVDGGTTLTVSIPTGKAHLPAEQISEHSSLSSRIMQAQPFVEEALRWLPQEMQNVVPIEPDEMLVWHKPEGQKVHILLAEDNADMRNYVYRLLEPHCEVTMVPDGLAALEFSKRVLPDLILSDIMMPNMDGYALLTALRKDPILKTIPVILLSARAGEEARVEGLQAGADDYLVKPFNARELLVRVKANLNLELHWARQEAEEARRASEERFRTLFNQAAAGIIQTDLTGKFMLMNQRYCEMVGRTQEELLHLSMQDVTHPDDLDTSLNLFAKAISEGISFVTEKRYVLPDGACIWVRNHVTLIRDHDGNPQSMLAVSQEITDRKNAELALSSAQAELKDYAGKLERSNKELEHFATIASHDLQEPLRKIMMFSDHLRTTVESVLSEEALDDIARMQRATRRMQALIDDLLNLSRVTRKSKPFQSTDLAEVMEEVLFDLDLQIKEARGKVEVGPMMQIDTDPGQFRQLMHNLISNALKFHQPGQSPEIKVYTIPVDENNCVIKVEDHGIGIKAEYRDKIFDAFVRLHGKDAYPGTGIGLAIVKKIVERHKGTITILGREGEGTTFAVQLPIHQK